MMRARTQVALLVAACIVMGLARTGQNGLDTIYAEDGQEFLGGALAGESIVSVYNGYIHVVPRLLALIPATTPLEVAPAVLAVLGATVTAACAAVVFLASRTYIASPWIRAGLAGYLVLMPVIGEEVANNIAYAQWPMTAAATWILAAGWSRKQAWAAAAFLALTALSAPQAIVLVPLAIAYPLLQKCRHAFVVASGLMGGIAVQYGFVLANRGGDGIKVEVLRIVEAALERVIGAVFFGDFLNVKAWETLGQWPYVAVTMALGAVCAAALVAYAVKFRFEAAPVVAAVGMAAVVFLFCAIARSTTLAPPAWSQYGTELGGARYFMLPAYFLASAACIAVARLHATGLRIAKPVTACLVAIALVSVTTSFFVPSDGREDSSWSTELQGARQECSSGLGQTLLQTAPVFTHQDWHVTVPCKILGASP